MSLKDYEILDKKGIGISGFGPPGQPGFEPPKQPGFIPPSSGFGPLGQPGFGPPGQQGFNPPPSGLGPPRQPGFNPPPSSFGPPQQSGFEPQKQPGFNPPPSSFGPPQQSGFESQKQPGYIPPPSGSGPPEKAGFEPPKQPGFNPPPSGFEPPKQPGYIPPPSGSGPPGQPGFNPPPSSFGPPGQPGYIPPPSGFGPPGQPGFGPPGQPGFMPPPPAGFAQGEQGGVFIAIDKKTKEKVAIKKIPINYQDFRFEKEINNEINSLKTINCENSLKYYTHFIENGCYYIVTELCDSDLKTYVEKEHTNRFTSEEIREIFLQLNNAFRIMRQYNIMHRDLKLANIMIKNLDNGKKVFKLGDFGKSRVLVSNRPGYYEKTQIGELTIKAPELCKGSKYEKLFYDEKCDLWSIGVMMHHIYFQHLPPIYLKNDFREEFDEYYYYLINNVRNSRHMHPHLRDLMFKLLVIDPAYRISWYEYFTHPFFLGK